MIKNEFLKDTWYNAKLDPKVTKKHLKLEIFNCHGKIFDTAQCQVYISPVLLM